jgi:ABC-type dipeptide/oligopeptide/nickel transport system permease component
LITIPIIYSIAITSGIYAARHRGKLLDVSTGVTFIGLYSLPTMWVGVMLLGFFASRDYFQWFPTGGLHDIASSQFAFLPGYVDGHFNRGKNFATFVGSLLYPTFMFLATGILVLPVRHPVLLAKEISTLCHLSNNRDGVRHIGGDVPVPSHRQRFIDLGRVQEAPAA